MPIEVFGEEELIPLGEAAKLVSERTGVKLTVKGLIGWRVRGIRGVKLDCTKVGHRWYTTREALEEFFAESTRAALGEEIEITLPPASRAALAAQEKARRMLEE